MTGTTLRTPWGTVPSLCGGAAAILTVISGLEFMAVSLRFAVAKPFVAAGPCAHPVKVLMAAATTGAAIALSTSLRSMPLRSAMVFKIVHR